jgi:hypothetical protein
VARRVRDAGEPVGVVIGVRSGLAVLVGHRCPLAKAVVSGHARLGPELLPGK